MVSYFGTACAPSQHPAHGVGIILPGGLLFPQDFSACFGQMVIPARSVVIRDRLKGCYIPLFLQAVQQRVQGTGLQMEAVVRAAAQLIDHLVAVHVAVLQQLQHQHDHTPADEALVHLHNLPPIILICLLYIENLYMSRIFCRDAPGGHQGS